MCPHEKTWFAHVSDPLNWHGPVPPKATCSCNNNKGVDSKCKPIPPQLKYVTEGKMTYKQKNRIFDTCLLIIAGVLLAYSIYVMVWQ